MYIFVDEAGDLSDFSVTGSKYFLLAAVIANDHGPCNGLTDLRHDLERELYELPRGFHAKNDPKPRRQRVLKCLREMHIEIHLVAIRKEIIFDHLRTSEAWLYGFALKKVATSLSIALSNNASRKRLVLPSYSTGTLKRQTAVLCRNTVLELFPQVFEIAIWESSSHAGSQIADYCSWAIQRKLERDDDTALNEISQHIKSVISPWGDQLILL